MSVAEPVFARTFVNRKAELAYLRERWEQAEAGHGSIVCIEGEAGSGKSRLMAEARKTIGAGGFTAVGACLPYAAASFAPLADILRDAIVRYPGVAPPQPYLRTVLRAIVPSLSPPFEQLSAAPELQRRWLLDAIVETLGRLSATTVAAILFEDLHWADAGTLDAIRFIAPKLEHLRVALCLTYRSDAVAVEPQLASLQAELERLPTTHRIVLAELEPSDSRLLAEAALPSGVRLLARTLDRICKQSGGHPLFIEELVKHSVEAPAARSLPTSIDRLIGERLESFDENERYVLGCASALLGAIDVNDLSSISLQPVSTVGTTLAKARDRNILIEQRGETSSYRFRHDLTRQIAYKNIAPQNAMKLHTLIAQKLEASNKPVPVAELAHHFRAAGNVARAAEYGERAGDDAAARYSYADAAEEYERVLTLTTAAPLRIAEIELKAARMLALRGASEAALEHYRSAAARFGSAGEVAKLAQTYVDCAFMESFMLNSRAIDTCRSAILTIGSNPENPLFLRAHLRLANLLFLRGDRDEAKQTLAVAAEGEPYGEAIDRSKLKSVKAQIALTEGAVDDCVTLYIEAVSEHRDHSDYENIANDAVNLGAIATEFGRPTIAKEYLTLAREVAQRYRLDIYLAYVHLAFANFCAEYESLELARTSLLETLRLGIENPLIEVTAAEVALAIAVPLGDRELTERFASEAILRSARESAEPTRFGPVALGHAEILLVTGKREAALALLTEAVALMKDASNNYRTLLCIAREGWSDEVPRAELLLREAVDKLQTRRALAYLRLFEAHRKSSRGEPYRDEAQDALAIFSELGIARCVAAASELLRRFDQARAAYERAGDYRALDRLTRGKDLVNLSQREAEIAALLAGGKTNRTIALSLALSERTVEHHVASVLRKLKARTRTEVALLLADKPRRR